MGEGTNNKESLAALGGLDSMAVRMVVETEVKGIRQELKGQIILLRARLDRLESEGYARNFELRTSEGRVSVLCAHLEHDVYPVLDQARCVGEVEGDGAQPLKKLLELRLATYYSARAEELRIRKFPSEALVMNSEGNVGVAAFIDEQEEETTVTILVENLPGTAAYRELDGAVFTERLKRDATGAARKAVTDLEKLLDAERERKKLEVVE
jgi:hypothetical protein